MKKKQKTISVNVPQGDEYRFAKYIRKIRFLLGFQNFKKLKEKHAKYLND